MLLVTIAWTSGAAVAPLRFIPTLEAGDAIPTTLALTAQNGRQFTFSTFAGRAVVVSFIYTRCPDPRMCPLVAAKFATLQQSIGIAPIRLLLVTLDPAYDTPAVLERYGRRFGRSSNWTLATGAPTTIDEFAARLGIATARSIPGSVTHTEAAVVVGPDGRIAQTIYGNAWTPGELLAGARATLPAGHSGLLTLRTWLGATLERCGGGALALGGGGMVAVFLGMMSVAGAVFWLAFRTPRRPVKTGVQPSAGRIDTGCIPAPDRQ